MARPPRCACCPEAFRCIAIDSYPAWGRCQRCGSAWYHHVVRVYVRCPTQMQHQPDQEDQTNTIVFGRCLHCIPNYELMSYKNDIQQILAELKEPKGE